MDWCCLFAVYTGLFTQFRFILSCISYLTSYHWTFLFSLPNPQVLLDRAPAQPERAGSREPSRAKARQRRAGIRHRADINSRQLPLSEPLCLRAQGCLYPTRPMSKAGGADRLPARAGCTFCHEQQKVPKNALHVTFAARTAGGAALSRAAPLPLNQFTAKDLCLGRQSRFARMTQDPVACAGVKQ